MLVGTAMLDVEVHCCSHIDWQHAAPDVLSEQELRHAASLNSTVRRSQFFAGRLLIRRMLCKIHGGDLTDWTLTAGQGIKPVIEGVNDIHFSISHSADYLLCAVSDLPLGVDVEKLKPGRDVIALAQEVCHPDERNRLLALSSDLQPMAFMQYWVLKEAWLKRRGMGLDVPQMRMLSSVAGEDRHADALTADFVHAGAKLVLSVVAANLDELNLDMACQFRVEPFKRWRILHGRLSH